MSRNWSSWNDMEKKKIYGKKAATTEIARKIHIQWKKEMKNFTLKVLEKFKYCFSLLYGWLNTVRRGVSLEKRQAQPERREERRKVNPKTWHSQNASTKRWKWKHSNETFSSNFILFITNQFAISGGACERLLLRGSRSCVGAFGVTRLSSEEAEA